jgi:hypothetical protein
MTTRTPRAKAAKPGRLKDRLKNNRRAEFSVPVYLRGDLYAEIQELDIELVRAGTQPDDRLSSGADKRAIAERIEALRAEMESSVEVFRLRALPPGDHGWNALVAQFPPNDENEEDVKAGVDLDAFNLAVVRKSIVSPEIDDEDWAAMLDPETGIADAQFDDLVKAAWRLNKAAVSVPFSSAASRVLGTSAR